MGENQTPESLKNYLENELPRILEKEQIPGASIALIKGDEIIFMQGLGYKDYENKIPVTTKTQFAIGSTSKALTATVLGILADQGKLGWDDLVIEHVPEFRMKDPVATTQLAIRDILCHRSGLPRHDLAWLLSKFDRAELLHKIRYLEPFVPFRSRFHYNNFMWMLAGIVGERITGKSWEENVRELIFEPLGIQDANFSVTDMQNSPDYACAYDIKDGEVLRIPPRPIDPIGPAGSINAHIEDYARWLMLNINGGQIDGKQLVSTENLTEIHAPQMAIPIQDELGMAFRMMEAFSDLVYTLGWVSLMYRGRAHVMHAGGIDGYSSFLTFLPKEKIGAAVLTNSGGITKHYGIILEIVDRYLGDEPTPWIEKISTLEKMALSGEAQAEQEFLEKQIKNTSPSHPLEHYAGVFTHPAYGKIVLELKDGSLAGTYNQYPVSLHHYHYDVFQMNLDDLRRGFKFPLQFHSDQNGIIHKLLLPLEPNTPEIEFTREEK
jgi:CubicO group peptidase (beta-lactamase class C family)